MFLKSSKNKINLKNENDQKNNDPLLEIKQNTHRHIIKFLHIYKYIVIFNNQFITNCIYLYIEINSSIYIYKINKTQITYQFYIDEIIH